MRHFHSPISRGATHESSAGEPSGERAGSNEKRSTRGDAKRRVSV